MTSPDLAAHRNSYSPGAPSLNVSVALVRPEAGACFVPVR